MGAVRNLFVRIGGDASGAVKSFKDASSAGANAEKSIKKSSAETKRSIRETFTSSVPSIKEYTAQVTQTKTVHQTATQNVSRLKDEISRLTGIYDTVKNATSGLDLSKPLEELMVDAEKTLTAIESRRRKLEAELNSLTNSPKATSSKRTAALQAELSQLAEKSSFAQARMANLDQIAAKLGASNIGYASAKGLEQLQQKIVATENELRTTQMVANEAKKTLQSMGVGVSAWQLIKKEIGNVKVAATGVREAFNSIKSDPNEAIANWLVRIGRNIKQIPANMLHSIANRLNSVSNAIRSIPNIPNRVWSGIKGIGTAAAYAAGYGVGKLWRGLKNLTGAVGRGIISLPSKLREIGRSAASGTGGLTKMVRSIRNIGIASLGMRVATGLFGRMRSIISMYISQNEELYASVTSLRNQMGDALLPAINIVIAAMQRLMPVVTAVSSGINSIFKTLFGDIATTSKKIESTAEELNTYGFDQITKESDTDSAAGSSAANQSGEQSALVTKLTGWLKELKSAFMAGDWKALGGTFAEGINSALDALRNVDVGGKVGEFINAVATTFHSLLSGIDFGSIGKLIGSNLNNMFSTVDWSTVGETIGMAILALPKTIVGFALETDWALVARSLSQSLVSTLNSITQWVKETDWLQLGENVATFIANIDWGGITSSLFEGLGAMLGGLASFCWGLIKDAWSNVVAWWKENAYEDGKFTIEGLLRGIGDVLINIGTWIKENIFDPFINGFCDAFKIHSPSVVMKEKGGFIISGLLNGITAAWEKVKSFFDTALSSISDKISGAFNKVKTTVSDIWNNGILPAVRRPVNSILECINGMISGICKAINAVIGALNGFSVDIPNWSLFGDLAGKKFGFNFSLITAPQIPLLETGGVLKKGQVGFLEGNGDEAVVPLQKNTGWIDTLASKLAAKTAGSNSGGGSATFQFYLGNRKITEYVVRDINQITRENGVCPIHV